MSPKYCMHCGTKAESPLAKFCASCGESLGSAKKESAASEIKPRIPSRFQRGQQSQATADGADFTDVDEIPDIKKLDVSIDNEGSTEFPGFSAGNSFSLNADGSLGQKKFTPRRL